jgi:hypothetical protein
MKVRDYFVRQGFFAGLVRKALLLGFACAFLVQTGSGFAEEQNPKKPKHRNTPLDTILQTRLWADVPEPKDFVKEHRPKPGSLDYQPVTGTDPERPKLRTQAELKDLDTELEAARLSAAKRAGIKPASSKPKPATAAN